MSAEVDTVDALRFSLLVDGEQAGWLEGLHYGEERLEASFTEAGAEIARAVGLDPEMPGAVSVFTLLYVHWRKHGQSLDDRPDWGREMAAIWRDATGSDLGEARAKAQRLMGRA